MSKFFGGESSSESESSEDDVESEEEMKPVAAAPVKQGAKTGAAAFMKGDDSDDSDDEKKRVVRSHRDKKWDAMLDTVNQLKKNMKINDWNALEKTFSNLEKMLAKAHQLVAKEGTPTFYFKALIMLEQFVNKTNDNKAGIKQMSQLNAKAFNGMKQKIKKLMRTHEKDVARVREEMEAAGADGEQDSEEEEEESKDSSSEDDATPLKGKAAFMKAPPPKKPAAAKPPPKQEEFAPSVKPAVQPKGPKPIAQYNEADIDERLDQLLATRGRKGTNKAEQLSILTQLAEVTKRPSKLVELLGHVIAFNFDMHLNMLTAMPVKVWKEIFDVFSRILATLVANPDLKIVVIEGSTVVDSTQMTTAEVGDEEDEFIDTGITQMTGNVLSYLERLDDEFYKSLQFLDPHAPEYVSRLKDEVPLINLMQDTLAYYDSNPQDLDSRESARVASRIVEHIYYREQAHFNKAMHHAMGRKQQLEDAAKAAAKAAFAAVELAEKDEEEQDEDDESENDEDDEPSKTKTVLPSRKAANQAVAAAAEAKAAHANFAVPREMDLALEMKTLSARIFSLSTERAKTRALLCGVYHHALHGRYQTARDMLLMSHLADTIHQFDIATQILYNRALVRCGICAFENELVSEAHSSLMEIAAGARLKELLAQGISSGRFNERNPEQEKQERRRLVPYHMHMNLELVEAIHLVCAMLLELPNLAHNAFDPKRRSAAVSKTFRRLLDHFERQVFNGPPENIRDHIMSASQLLLEGKWRDAATSIEGMPVWGLLRDPDASRRFIRRQIQVEGVRSYLISSYAHYDSISLESISTRFELSKEDVHAIVSKMMLTGSELHACWDQPTSTIVVQRTEPSKLQFLALQLADKVASFVETNEFVLDSRTGSYGYKFNEHSNERRDGGMRERRPWVERGERYGGGGGGGRAWYNNDRGFDRGYDRGYAGKGAGGRGDAGGRGGGGRGWNTNSGGRSSAMYVERNNRNYTANRR